MYESMTRDLAPLSLSILAIVIVLFISFSAPADPTEADQEAPGVEAGPDQTVALGETVTFDGSLSTDNMGIVSWQWSLVYGGAPVSFGGEMALFTFEITGIYEVTLVVTDSAGNSAEDTFRVTVTA